MKSRSLYRHFFFISHPNSIIRSSAVPPLAVFNIYCFTSIIPILKATLSIKRIICYFLFPQQFMFATRTVPHPQKNQSSNSVTLPYVRGCCSSKALHAFRYPNAHTHTHRLSWILKGTRKRAISLTQHLSSFSDNRISVHSPLMLLTRYRARFIVRLSSHLLLSHCSWNFARTHSSSCAQCLMNAIFVR